MSNLKPQQVFLIAKGNTKLSLHKLQDDEYWIQEDYLKKSSAVVLSEDELKKICEGFYSRGLSKGQNINDLPTPRVDFEQIYKEETSK